MPSPYSIIGIVAASFCWLLAGLWNGPRLKTVRLGDEENPMAFRRSAYGSLAARLMKDSMHNYWHAGQAGHHSGKTESPHERLDLGKDQALDIDKQHRAGSFKTAAKNRSWLERRIDGLAELEEARLTSTSTMSVSKAHRRYLDATAHWHLRVAYRLDPGDAALYEILHCTVMSGAAGSELARIGAEHLASQTIAHALSEQGGMSAALTGAGAAINLLNNDMVSDSGVGPEVIRRHWEMLSNCLKRYRALKTQAVAGGGWEGVPQVRRGELTAYAALVERLSITIARRLTATGVLIGQAEDGS